MLQRYSFSNNYHVKYLSDGWIQHLCCGIVSTFDARENDLRTWVVRTKACGKLSYLRFFPTIFSSEASLLLTNYKHYF